MTDTGHPDPIPLPTPQRDWALFLDIDGTLLDLAPTPTDVVIPPDLPDLLRGLNRVLGGAVAVVSGRTLTDIDGLLSPLALPAAGQHGAEIRLPNGQVERFHAAAKMLEGLMPKIDAFAAAHPGILVEDKGMTIAVHCRLAPQYQSELGQFLNGLTGEHSDCLETIGGHRVFEVKPRNLSKRTAVEHFMRLVPFAGRLPVFIGDDRTDEDGFAAVKAAGGYAIRVGLDGQSIADWRIADPTATRAFLLRAAETLTADAR